jgi:hypothetical protein
VGISCDIGVGQDGNELLDLLGEMISLHERLFDS